MGDLRNGRPERSVILAGEPRSANTPQSIERMGAMLLPEACYPPSSEAFEFPGAAQAPHSGQLSSMSVTHAWREAGESAKNALPRYGLPKR